MFIYRLVPLIFTFHNSHNTRTIGNYDLNSIIRDTDSLPHSLNRIFPYSQLRTNKSSSHRPVSVNRTLSKIYPLQSLRICISMNRSSPAPLSSLHIPNKTFRLPLRHSCISMHLHSPMLPPVKMSVKLLLYHSFHSAHQVRHP